MGMLLSFLTGSGLKLIVSSIGKMIEMKRQKDLLMMNADINKIKVLQGGEDTLSPWGKVTRRILAFSLVGTFCFIVIWHVIINPDQTYTIMIDKSPSILFGWIMGTTDKTTLVISAGSLLWDFQNIVSLIAGFYFTKISKGG